MARVSFASRAVPSLLTLLLTIATLVGCGRDSSPAPSAGERVATSAQALTTIGDQPPDGPAANTNGGDMAQTFTAPAGAERLTQVQVRVIPSGSNAVTADVRLYAWSGSSCVGAVLFEGVQSLAANQGFTTLTFPTSVAVTAGATYAIVLFAPRTLLEWSADAYDGYLGGDFYTRSDSNDTAPGWSALGGGGVDAWFTATFEQLQLGVTSSNTTPVVGQPVTFTATVTSDFGTASGNVTFTDSTSGRLLGYVPVSGGKATLTAPVMTAGTETVTATFNGNRGDGTTAAASGTVVENVGKATSHESVTCSPSSVTYPQTVSCTAQTTVAAPGAWQQEGTVTFTDTVNGTTTTLGTAAPDSTGAAALAATTLAAGSHTITATYSGPDYTPSSGTATVNVAPETTTTQIGASPQNVAVGQSTTLSVGLAVTGSTEKGSFTLKDGATTIATVPYDGTTVVKYAYTVSGSVGTHTITASYAPNDSSVAPSQGTTTLNVSRDGVTVTGSAEPPSGSYGDVMKLLATVKASSASGTPQGSVTFLEGTTTIGTASLDSSGNALLVTYSLTGGSHRITASYGGDAAHTGGSAQFVVTITPTAPPVTLTAAANPTVTGQTTTFTATVSSIPNGAPPTGTVTFANGGTVFDTQPLTNGSATSKAQAFPLGSNTITATYQGDGNYAKASASLTETVNAASTTTTVSSSQNPSTVGSSVTFTAAVSAVAPGAGTPTGTVTFQDGTAVVGTATLSGGIATFATSTLAVGSHAITAAYGGVSGYSGSTSRSVTQVVQQAGTSSVTVALQSSGSPITYGQPVTFTATISANAGGAPNGTVTFSDGTTVLAKSQPLTNGKSTFTTSALDAGAHTITATYDGDANHAGGAQATIGEQVNAAASTTKVTTSGSPVTYGTSVTFTATVTSAATGHVPGGSVVFSEGATTLGTAKLDGNGAATFATSTLSVGTHTITVTYGGDTDDAMSSGNATEQITQTTTTTTVTSSSNPASVGASVTFTASVKSSGGNVPTGGVTFYDGMAAIGTATLDTTGSATTSTSALGLGTHAITAAYAGDTNDAKSTSQQLSEVISANAPTLTETATPNPSTFGQAVTLAATVTGTSGAATGTVTFTDGTSTTPIGSATLDGNGAASVTTSSLAVGTHAIAVAYSGDKTYGVTTGTLSVTVNDAPTTDGGVPDDGGAGDAGSDGDAGTSDAGLTDGGLANSDAGGGQDDAGSAADGGTTSAGGDDSGCGCMTTGASSNGAAGGAALGLAVLVLGSRRRRRRASKESTARV